MTAGANNGVDWTRTGDAEVRSRLQEELERLEECDPFAALGLERGASDREVRAAFLHLTKTYHPNRFARHEAEIFRLANEVFLRMKKAYSKISSATLRERELVRLGEKPNGAGETGDSGAEESVEDLGRAPTVKVRTLPDQGLPADRDAAAEPPGRKPIVPPAPSSSVPPTGKPNVPPAPKPNGAPTATSPTGRDRKERGGTGRGTGAATAKHAVPTEVELRRAAATMRRMRRAGGSSHPVLGAKKAEVPPDLAKEFRAAKAKLETGAFGTARAELKQLAVQDPNNKDFRVYMHYAWGREHQAAGRADEARAEYSRALALDADFEPARAAIESLEEPKSRGLLSKWFRK